MFLNALFLGFLIACTPIEKIPPPPLTISHVLVSSEKIEEGKPLPEFSEHFEEGHKVLYAYVFFENVQTMTGSFPVRFQWFSPNDFSPPIGMSSVEMAPPSSVAEFALHDGEGLKRGPYQALVFAGEPLTATGSVRFFVNMTPEETEEFMKADVFARVEQEKRRKEAEEKAKLEEKEKGTGSGEMMGGSGGLEGVLAPRSPEGEVGKGQEELPPALTGGEKE